MITYKNVRILNWHHQPHGKSSKIGLTKKWRDLLKVMHQHMKKGGAVTMVQHGELCDVELLP